MLDFGGMLLLVLSFSFLSFPPNKYDLLLVLLLKTGDCFPDACPLLSELIGSSLLAWVSTEF